MKIPVTCLLVFLASALNAYGQAPNLQTAGNFAVLAGGGIVSADAGTTIVGNVGSSPTPTVTGLLASQVTGTLYTAANAVLTNAQTDLTAAYVDAAGRPSCTALTGALGTGTNANLGPGLYCYSSAALLNGTLTLTGSATDVWIFQIGSSLTTATGATVAFAGGASPCNVYWQVGSSATIQTGNTFAGNILALASITLNGGSLSGRALARNGTVTISGKETIISGCSSGTVSPPTIVVSPVNSAIICGAVGSSITKTAVVLSNGVPVVDATVTFTITGPDAGMSGTAITDATGTATFKITAPSLTSSAGDSVVATVNGGTVISNTTFATCSGSTSGSFCSTAPSPTVTLMSVTTGPPKQVVLSVQSTGGLSSVVVDTPPTTNATVAILPFDSGSTQALGVTATKIDQSASAVVELTVVDLCGHTTVFDPVFATITIPAADPRSNFNHVSKFDSDNREVSRFNSMVRTERRGSPQSEAPGVAEFDFDHWVAVRFDGIVRTEGIVFLQNGTPGVESLVITVNGTRFRTKLLDGMTKKIDISSALFQGTNRVTIAAFGDEGSSVDLSISDGK
ncbi:MAG: ice-binding family protein [Candidatus Acidiferrales bacterium]